MHTLKKKPILEKEERREGEGRKVERGDERGRRRGRRGRRGKQEEEEEEEERIYLDLRKQLVEVSFVLYYGYGFRGI